MYLVSFLIMYVYVLWGWGGYWGGGPSFLYTAAQWL